MKEIGGYFEFEHFFGKEYHRKALRLNTARSCLWYIINSKNYKKIFIPYFLCDSIKNFLHYIKFNYEFYKINSLTDFDINIKPKKNECLYIVDYYGLLSKEKILFLKNKFKNIILDYSHSFFKFPVSNVETFYSCRKFFGVPDGAYLYLYSKNNIPLEQDLSFNRFEHLFGRFEFNAQQFYKSFKKNNDILKDKIPFKMSKLTQNILKAINYDIVIKKRNDNFNYLHSRLNKINILKFDKIYAPFSYPLLTNNIELRRMLIDKNIFIPTLWPNCTECNDEKSKFYSTHIIPLPCDQRYNKNDMDIICKHIFRLV